MNDGRKIYTVSELNNEIKFFLEESYPGIWLEGEISNLKAYPSGHIYFTLKDSDAQISAVLFQGFSKYIKFKLENGLKIIVKGRISSYPKRGDYQIVVTYIEPAGRGSLQLAFEQLKEKLEKEGLFSAERKKTMPLIPQKIGIITSPSGAAIRDILSVIERRFANVEILIYPVRVQGDEAKYDIVSAIEYLNRKYVKLDVVLLGRGGGSYEDLWAFNEEIVARAIAASKIPIISCVGHEIDFTIADFVADLRAATPSAAAELVVKNKYDLIEKLYSFRQYLKNKINFIISNYEQKLDYLSGSNVLRRPQQIFEDKLKEIDEYSSRMIQALQRKAELKENKFIHILEKLNLLSPLNVLNRGYSVCWKYPQKTIIKDSKVVNKNDLINILLNKGELICKVEKIILNG